MSPVSFLTCKSMRSGWRARIAYAVLAMTFSLPAVSAELTPQDAVIEAISQGRDASALLQNLETGAQSSVAVRNTTGKQMATALVAMSSAVNSGNVERIKAAYERVQASAMLVQDDSTALKAKLAEASLPSSYESRRASVQAQIDQLLQQLAAGVAGLDSGAQQKTEALAALRTALRATAQVQSDPQILRAALMPVRPLSLAARTPTLSPAVRPSYEIDQEVAALPEDVADAPEAPLSEEILAKAMALDYDYVRIYEFVRNNIRSEWYAGSVKGALGTLRTGAGNSVDQASLLIAMMRASGAPARYVQGVAELSVEALAATAGMADPSQVPDMLTKAGIAYSPVVQGGRVAMVRVEHHWATVLVPYTNYRGVVLDATGKTWLPLDVFYKTLQPKVGNVSFVSLSLELPKLMSQFRSAPQEQDFGAYLRSQVDAALRAQSAAASASYETVTAPGLIKAQTLGLLPSTLGFTAVVVTAESTSLPPTLLTTVRLRLFNDATGGGEAGLDVSLPAYELFNQRATINYIPAELADHRAILLAGGLDLAPAYLYQLRPELRLDGYQYKLGLAPLAGGSTVKFRLDIQTSVQTQTVEQSFLVGAYHAISLGQSGVARSAVRSARDSEYDAARLLDGIAQRYESQWTAFEAGSAQLAGAAVVHPAPSITIVSNALSVYSVNAAPYSLEWKGVTIDAASRPTEVVSGNANNARQLLQAIGLAGSSLEHRIFETQFGVESISADKLVTLAKQQGITVHTLQSATAPEIGALPVSDAVKAELKSFLQLGYSVEIPDQTMAHRAWRGTGWIVTDPSSGGSGYFLAGGIAGGTTAENPWTNQFLADALAGAHTDAPNNDPSAGVSVEILNTSADLRGTAGQTMPQPMSVRVRDRDGRPVKGASVSFLTSRGGGAVGTVNGTTNALGVATSVITLGQSTSASPVYIRRASADVYLTQAGLNVFDVSVASSMGALKPSAPLQIMALPDVPAALKHKRLTEGSATPGIATTNSTYSIEVLDKFSNPIANVKVSGVGLAASASCDPAVRPTPATVDGPHTTDTFGVVFLAVTPGPTNGTTSPVQVTAGNLSATVEVRVTTACGAAPEAIAHIRRFLDKDGNTAAATGVGKRFEQPFGIKLMQQRASAAFNASGTCVYQGTRSFEPLTTASPSLEVSAGGSSLGIAATGAGIWESYVLTGPAPAKNELLWNVSGSTTYDDLHTDGGTCRTAPRRDSFSQTFDGGAVFGVRSTISSITSADTDAGIDANRLYLNDSGFNAYPIKIAFKLEPEAYKAPAVQVRVFEQEQLIGVLASSSTQKQGDVRIERGDRFDIVKSYFADAYISEDIISEKEELPFKQRIVTSYDKVLRLSRDVDIANDRFCAIGSALNFVLSQSARITLEATPLSDSVNNPTPVGSPLRLIDGQSFALGANSIPLAPDALLPTKNGYVFTLTAVSDKEGTVEPNEGRVISTLLLNDSLPVGNILVNGVNVKSGRISVAGLGFGIAARGPQLSIRPSYSSGGSGKVGVLGVNWGHNFDASLSTTACGDILINAGDGGFIRFLPEGNGSLRPAKGYHGTLVPNHGDKSYDFYSKDGTRYHFGFIGGKRQWALQSITDTNGNALTLTYDTGVDAPLVRVDNAYGQSLQFVYQTRAFVGSGSPVNVLQTVQGPEGMGLAFDYDGAGNLIKINRTDDASAVETYSYSDYSNPLGVANLMLGHTNALGKTTQFEYHSGPIMRQFSNGQIPSYESTVIGVTTADGAKTGFTYNANTQTPATAVLDALGAVTNYTFNKYGNPLTIEGPAGTTRMVWGNDDVVMLSKTDANGVTTNFGYDPNGNQTSEQVVGEANGSTSQTWLSQTVAPFIKSKRLTFTDRRGLTTTSSYDTRGNLVGEKLPDGSTITYSVAANGDLQTRQDGRGNTTTMRYDARGMRNAVVDPMGGSTITRYDNRGRQTAVVDAEGRTTEMLYNTLDQLTQVTLAAGTPVAGKRTTVWDALGNRLSDTDEEGRVTTYTYNAVNRLVRKAAPIGAVVTTYDLAGNKTSETNLRGAVTQYVYDAANRLVERTEPTVPPKVTAYGYDGVGNITSETDGLGRKTVYTYNKLNQRTATQYADGTASTVVFDGNGNKESETDALGRTTTYTYDGLNRLLSQTIAGHSKRSMGYDANGNLTSRTDANGNTSAFSFDPLNRIVAETDALGRVTNTDYDRVGNKLQVTNPLRQARKWQYNARNWALASQDEEGHQTKYSYDKVGNKLSETWANGNVLAFEYDAMNRLVRSTDSLGQVSAAVYDADGNITSQMDGRGNTIAMTWDAIGRQLSHTQPTAAGNAVTTNGYDAAGNLTTVTAPNGNVVTTQYDSRNRPLKISDSIGVVSSTTYDAVGNALTQTDGRGRVLTHTYNDYNLRTATQDSLGPVSTASYDLHGNKTAETDGNGQATTYQYDALHRVVITKHAGIQTKKSDYDEAGRLQYETDANGNKVGYEYDKRGLLVKTNRSLGAIDQLQRNMMGDVTLATDPESRMTATQYDLRRRATRLTDGEGNSTQTGYDLAGNVVELKAPSGSTVSYDYDSANRLMSVIQSLASGTAQASRSYDTTGNLVSQSDLNGNITGYGYDARNRRTTKTLPGGAVETNGYDGADGLVSHTDANGSSFVHTLDIRGQRSKTQTTPTAANSPGSILQVSYSYDGNGNATSTTQTDSQGVRSETTSYDAFNRPVKATDAWGNSLTHSYDAQGNRTATTASPGGAVTSIQYDALNRRITQSGAGGLSRISYDKSSLVTRILHPDGSSTATTYDKAGRVAQETSSTQEAAADGNTIYNTRYTYDVNSNRIGATRTEALAAVNRSAALSAHLPGGTNNGSHIRSRTESWTYDQQDRLTGHTTPERSTTWQLDAGGRRIAQTVVATAGSTGPPAGANDLEATAGAPLGTLSYSYNSRDQLTQITGAISATYTYDANGNRTSQVQNGTTTRYHWSAQDQLFSVEKGSGSSLQALANYRYNAAGLRAEKLLSDEGLAAASQTSSAASPLAHERIQWDGLHARRSYEVVGTSQTLRADTDAAVLLGNTAPWLFNRTNYAGGLGSTTQLHADSNGNLTATVTSEGGAAKADSLLVYSPYGLVDAEASGNAGTGLSSNANAFGSYYADPESGLLYARARYFDPASGQFIGRDPQEGEANLPITWGAYQYGRYNPFRYSDPNGEEAVPGSFCTSAEECSALAKGALATIKGVGISLWDGTKEAAKQAISLARTLGESELAMYGDQEAQRKIGLSVGVAQERVRNLSNVLDIAGDYHNGIVKQLDQLNNGGDVYGVIELASKHSTDIAALGSGIYGVGKSTVSLTKFSRVGGASSVGVSPVAAAKAVDNNPTPVLLDLKAHTPVLITERKSIGLDGDLTPPVRSAVAVNSAVNDEIEAIRRISRNNASAESLLLDQKINLRGAVREEYSRITEGMSNGKIRNEIGPVFAGVMDTKTGDIYFGINKGAVPDNISPFLDNRLAEAQRIPYERTHGAGTHAEIHALNEGLNSRLLSQPSDFLMFTINSGHRSPSKWGMAVPRCPQCEFLTDGVKYFPEGLRYKR